MGFYQNLVGILSHIPVHRYLLMTNQIAAFVTCTVYKYGQIKVWGMKRLYYELFFTIPHI